VTHRASTIAECGQLSDAELMKLSLSQPDCFGGIFDRHAAEILRYVHARLGPGLAEDAVAETFSPRFATGHAMTRLAPTSGRGCTASQPG
jgi:RNA polymerase sigma-70 factor, ECF subfamily